jgi:hypothetical protein
MDSKKNLPLGKVQKTYRTYVDKLHELIGTQDLTGSTRQARSKAL